MKKKDQGVYYRDVQTLLFCKAVPSLHDVSNNKNQGKKHTQSYTSLFREIQNIAKPARGKDKKTFLTFGGYDALCIYPTNLDPYKREWLHDIYVDKQSTIRKPSNDVLYHQMHLVSQNPDTQKFWSESDEDYPFFLVTLIYGVNVDQYREKEKGKGDSYSTSEQECSLYEKVIRRYLENLPGEDTSAVKYAVYNGITVSDVVIVWKARDLMDAMKLISRIEYSGIARKTLSTLGFPVDEDGKVYKRVTDYLIDNLHMSTTISLHGAVRDIRVFLEVRNELAKAQNPRRIEEITSRLRRLAEEAYQDEKVCRKLNELLGGEWTIEKLEEERSACAEKDEFLCKLQMGLEKARLELCCAIPERNWTQSLGKNDFTVTARVSYANLANLLDAYQSMHEKFYNACWEILADIRTEHIDPADDCCGTANMPTRILCDLYKDYQQMYADNKNNDLNIMKYSWFNALQELLSTHHYIDHHPVLHGPSYLIYKSLRIAYSYFAGQVKDYDTPEKQQMLLKRSEESIIDFIQNLDQLTEQITRNDDAMLNNYCNARTIHFSLPESALEFYHAFLRRIVDYVLEYDKHAESKPEDFEYDFLLCPITCSRFSSHSVFQTDHQDHDYLSGKVWPNKQAYMLELPLESIFRPIDIFIPFVHECFHCFGDRLRQRELRKQDMSLFIASSLLNRAKMGKTNDRDLCRLVAQFIYPGETHASGDYLRVTDKQLEKSTNKLLNAESVDVLLMDWERPISMELRLRLDRLRAELFRINSTASVSKGNTSEIRMILDDCHHFFKEGYADAMAIALLGLRPKEYLESYRDELRRSYDKHRLGDDPQEVAMSTHRKLVLSAQRFGVVMAACSSMAEKGIGSSDFCGFTKEQCIQAIEEFKEKSKPFELKENTEQFAEFLKQCFMALSNMHQDIPSSPGMYAPVAMRYVMEYLMSAMEMLYQEAPILVIPNAPEKEYNIEKLQGDFGHIIREGNMFGKDFYNMIYAHHDEVRQKVGVKA